jgi:hypothetical protein
MSDPQRPEREAIERLRELLAKATPGPWKAESKNLGHAEYRAVGPAVINRAAADRDAELIALLRNLAPALLAALPPTPTPGWQPMEKNGNDQTQNQD